MTQCKGSVVVTAWPCRGETRCPGFPRTLATALPGVEVSPEERVTAVVEFLRGGGRVCEETRVSAVVIAGSRGTVCKAVFRGDLCLASEIIVSLFLLTRKERKKSVDAEEGQVLCV